MFPLTVKYQRRLSKCDIELANFYLDIIRKELNDQKIVDIKIENKKLDFKNQWFNGQSNWHLMSPIDGGFFQIDLQTCTLIYSYSIARTFYITFFMSSILGVIAYISIHSFAPWIFFFFWLFGMNWIISLVRQDQFITKLVTSLNKKGKNTSVLVQASLLGPKSRERILRGDC